MGICNGHRGRRTLGGYDRKGAGSLQLRNHLSDPGERSDTVGHIRSWCDSEIDERKGDSSLLLDLEFKDITGPLAQFQAKKVELKGLCEVIDSVNQAAGNVVPAERAQKLAEALWSDLEKRVEAIPKQAQAAKPARPQHEVLEELVGSVRSLDSRFREVLDELPRGFRGRRSRMHPMMMMELTHMLGSEPGNPVGILVIASLVRDDFPWLYELGVEAYRALRFQSPEEGEQALMRFRRAAKSLMHGPFLEEASVDPRTIDILFHELERFEHRAQPAEEEVRGPGRRKKAPKSE